MAELITEHDIAADIASFDNAPDDIEAPQDLIEQPDGSYLVRDLEAIEEPKQGFGENLVKVLDSTVLSRIASTQLDLIESDFRVRKPRDDQYTEGIRRTGLGQDAPGGAQFTGASKVVHPMLAKACVDFASRAAKELLPANGPVKTKIFGEVTDEKIDRAERKKQYMNWQLTRGIQEARAEFEQMLSQLPLGGAQYKRWYIDNGRPRTEAIYIDDVVTPFDEADFYTASRVTHRQRISRSTFEARIASKLYSYDGDTQSTTVSLGDASNASAATDKIVGQEEDELAYNENGLRTVYEQYVRMSVKDDPLTKGEPADYILHLDEHTSRPLGLYRNWSQEDKQRQRVHWIVEYIFIPWRGGRGIGLGHLIGSLAAGATGALRALLDSALIQNFPGALKLKGGRNSGQSKTVDPTSITEIDAPTGVDDIRKLVMGFPFPGPSNVLFTLLEWLTGQGEGTIAVASEKMADAGPNTPVGTTLAMIEMGSVNFSAIHARLHHSLSKELEVLHRLDGQFLTDKEVIAELGELTVSKTDFQGPMDIAPVSDPNIFSEAQRYAQLQAVMQLRADPQFAQFFKADKLLERAMKLLQIPGFEELANLPIEAQRRGPLEENAIVAEEQTAELKVYREQDDMAHLQLHLQFATSPMFGASPLLGPIVLPRLLKHCQDHLLALYRKHTQAAAATFAQIAMHQGAELTEEQAQAQGAAFADMMMSSLLGPMVAPALQQAYQAMQMAAPKPPPSPDVQARITGDVEIEKIRDMGKARAEQVKKEIESMITSIDADQKERDRQANERAALIARDIEAIGRASAEKMAHFEGKLALIRDENKANTDAMLMSMKADNERALLLLREMLMTEMAPMKQLATKEPAIVETPAHEREEMKAIAMIAQMVANQSEAFAKLGDRLVTLAKAPRKASYVRDPKTGRALDVIASVIDPEEPT